MAEGTQPFLGLSRTSPGVLARIPSRSAFLRPLLVGGVVLLIAAVVWAWFFWPAPLSTVQPRVGAAITAVYASGHVESTVTLPVAPRVGARLVRLASDEQQEVVKGQILARLESEDLAGNIAQLQAQADYARKDYERYARLMAQNATARQTYERTLATLRAADAALRQARAQAAFMTLIAPAACRVISRDGEVGQYITANTPIFWLACDPHLRVTAQVDEEDIRLVRAGQRAVVRADGMPGRIFEGNVSEVTPMGDPVGRSYRVRVALPEGTPLRIGMTVETNIVIQKRDNALLLPASAVADGKVWLVRNGEARPQSVVPGVRNGEWIEITSGLTRGDNVLPNGQAGPPPSGLRRLLSAP
jgi:RND family efflux transporter MFP subunit